MLFFSLIVTRTNAFRTNSSVYRDNKRNVYCHDTLMSLFVLVTIKLKNSM